MKPEVSIIVLSWNTAKITQQCLRSINQHLDGKLSYEIIVVDNASTDDSASLAAKEKKTIVIQNKLNLGFSKGNNLALSKAQGQYLLFLNSDIIFTDSHLVNMLNYLKSHPKIGIIGPKFLNPDQTPQGSVFPPQTALNAFRQYFLDHQDAYSKYTPKGNSPQKVWSISGGALLIKKNLFQKIGGWDERYHFYYEDLELCRQVRKLDHHIVYYPKMRVIHHHGASGKKLADDQNQWRRLIPSSKIYHGTINHYLINSIIWLSQKIKKA